MAPLTLLILDGWGFTEEKKATRLKRHERLTTMPCWKNFPTAFCRHQACMWVCHPVSWATRRSCHLTIGAGRVVIQKLTLISNTILDGTFFKNPVLTQAVDNAKAPGRALHLIGLVSDGCVHSSPDHLDGLIELARRNQICEFIVHPYFETDATHHRDPHCASCASCKKNSPVSAKLASCAAATMQWIATTRWERVEKYWRAIVLGDGTAASSAMDAVQASYEEGKGDEFVLPYVVTPRPIQDGDSVICFNFRPDRVRQISRALTDESFSGFERPKQPKIFDGCLTEYDASLHLPVAFNPSALPAQDIDNTLPELISCHHLAQFHTAETEKYAHVTYFLNGGKESACEGEERVLIPSLKIATYDLEPKMQTPKVCEIACQSIASGQYPFIVLNFANPDMVGHTGILEVAVEAVESVDEAFAKLLQAISEAKGTLVITADHGNCEQMIDLKTGEPHTAHTTNPVPLVVADFQANDIRGLKSGTKFERWWTGRCRANNPGAYGTE